MKLRTCYLCAVVGLAQLAVPAIHAAERIDEEIIVVGSYLPIDATRTAAATTVIDTAQIRDRAPLLVSDLLRDVPGLAVSRTGPIGSLTQVRARGAEGNQLLVLIDGVEANDPSQGDEFNWGTLVAAEIERIEIVRGPQTALSGSDAVSGVVNIVTRNAAAPFEADAWAEGGSFGTRQAGIGAGHRGERFHVRAGVSDLDSDGENVSRTGDEEDGYDNRTFNLKGGWRANEQASIAFAGRRSDGQTDFDQIDFSTGLPADSDDRSDFRTDTARLQGDYAALDGAWLNTLSVARTESDNRSYSNGLDAGSSASEKDQYRFVSSVAWADAAQRVSVLLEREDEEYEQRGEVQPWGDPNQDRRRNTDSAGLEYRGTFAERLTLAASARHDDNSEFDDADTWRLEAVYALPSATRLRAAWGTAVKNPTFTERFGFYTNFIGNPDLQPEESESVEFGVDQDWRSGAVRGSLTVFHADLEDEIDGFVIDPVSFGFTARNLDGRSERDGVELSLAAALGATVDLSASYTYTDATQPDAAGGDMEELRRAPHIGSLTLAWQPRNDLQLTVNAQYNGEQDDQFFPPWPEPSRIVAMDSYTLLSLTATWTVATGAELYVRGENLLDEDYEEIYGFRTPGAGGYLGLRYHFGG
jgi:vitamin B12 transporter